VLFAGLVALNLTDVRRERITRPLLRMYRKMLPSMSRTEREALEAGTVWWEGELFAGVPKWHKLLGAPAPQLSDEEQAFLDGPCEELCRMNDEWQVTHSLQDLSPETWKYLREQRLLRDDHPEAVRRPRVLRLCPQPGADQDRQPQRHAGLDRGGAELPRAGGAAAQVRHRGAEGPLAARAGRPARRSPASG
jgi:hypothetical protein